jgi:YjbE family integral membrane protein
MIMELLTTTTDMLSTGEFFMAALSIIAINLILAGDNAIVIGMTVRYLPPKQRLQGIIWGTVGAVVLRIALTMFTIQLLEIKYLKLIGGLLIFWIAVKLLNEQQNDDDNTDKKASISIIRAAWLIVLADLSMSVDNVLAVAGAAGGHFGLVIFGLALSIPIIVCAGNLLSKLMMRYQLLVYLGGTILGKVAGDMIITDPAILAVLPVNNWSQFAIPLLAATSVIFFAKVLPKLGPRLLSVNQSE